MYLSRSGYWLRVIGMILLSLILPLFTMLFGVGMFLIIYIWAIGVLIMQLIWATRRFHDVGLSGAWLLLSFLPGVGNLIVFIILLLPSDSFDSYSRGYDRRR